MRTLSTLLIAAALGTIATSAQAQQDGPRVQYPLGVDVGLERQQRHLEEWNARSQGPYQGSLDEWRARQSPGQRGGREVEAPPPPAATGGACTPGVRFRCGSPTGWCVCSD